MKKHRVPAKDKLAEVALVALDLDGVLTDGGKQYGPSGLSGLTFNARDGLGIYLLQKAGIDLVLLTSECGDIVRSRASDLGISEVLESLDNKRTALRLVRERRQLRTEQLLFVGDDLWDLEAFPEAGVRVAVADATPQVVAGADWVTIRHGGHGAVREVADALLAARDVDPLTLLRDRKETDG